MVVDEQQSSVDFDPFSNLPDKMEIFRQTTRDPGRNDIFNQDERGFCMVEDVISRSLLFVGLQITTHKQRDFLL